MGKTRAGTWISVDGVEGAGKTTLVDAFKVALGQKALFIAEFSDTPVGEYLRQGVNSDPHFFAGSRLGQSLLFLGDFFERSANVTQPAVDAGRVVIQDRGYLCKYAYQFEVLKDELGSRGAERLLKAIFAVTSPPDVTVLLIAPSEVLRHRLTGRGESVDGKRARFMTAAQEVLRARRVQAGQVLEFDTGAMRPQEIVSEVFTSLPQLDCA